MPTSVSSLLHLPGTGPGLCRYRQGTSGISLLTCADRVGRDRLIPVDPVRIHPLRGPGIGEQLEVSTLTDFGLSQLCGETLVILAASATLHSKIAMEVAGECQQPHS